MKKGAVRYFVAATVINIVLYVLNYAGVGNGVSSLR